MHLLLSLVSVFPTSSCSSSLYWWDFCSLLDQAAATGSTWLPAGLSVCSWPSWQHAKPLSLSSSKPFSAKTHIIVLSRNCFPPNSLLKPNRTFLTHWRSCWFDLWASQTYTWTLLKPYQIPQMISCHTPRLEPPLLFLGLAAMLDKILQSCEQQAIKINDSPLASLPWDSPVDILLQWTTLRVPMKDVQTSIPNSLTLFQQMPTSESGGVKRLSGRNNSLFCFHSSEGLHQCLPPLGVLSSLLTWVSPKVSLASTSNFSVFHTVSTGLFSSATEPA